MGILGPGAVALVTGASAGIGAATAAALVEKGARVICAARDKARLDELAARLGAGAHALELDVTDPTASLLERLPEELRRIDILIACAGHDVGGRTRFDQGRAGTVRLHDASARRHRPTGRPRQGRPPAPWTA